MRAEKTPGQGKRFSAAGHKEHIIVEPIGFVNEKACMFRESRGFKGKKFFSEKN